jgi:Signal transduction histidine kinase
MESHDDANLLAELFPEIATQLRSALGNIHFAAAALAPAEAREKSPEVDARAALLDQSYYQLLRLVDNLSAAALFSQKTPLTVRDQDIVKLTGDLCRRCDSLAELLGIHLEFVCAMSAHVCAFSKEGVEQLLYQLLSNAFKFTPRGGCVTVELKAGGSHMLLLSVSDTGCGIPPEILPTLFDRYLHKELMNPPPHGFGLGLPLCRRIAEEHGGSVVAESTVDAGTSVTVSLPDRVCGVTSVSDVPFDYAGGFNHTLLALSDALPPEAFYLRNQ